MIPCELVRSPAQARACQAASRVAQGLPWEAVVEELDYPTVGAAKRAALEHLEREMIRR